MTGGGAGTLVVCATRAAVATFAAERIVHGLQQAVTARGHASIALSGGNTPLGAYSLLADAPFSEQMPWPRIDWYWSDERCVPPESPESNFNGAWRTLLANAPIPAERIHRIVGETPNPDDAAKAYATALPPALDLLLLGIGEDGHIASLFPGSPALEEQESRVLAIFDSPKPPPCRLTITPPVIAAAREIITLAVGAAKAPAVARALAGVWNPREVPAQLVRQGMWIIDREAAAQLPPP